MRGPRSKADPQKNEEHRRNQQGAGRRPGFREFSTREERTKGSRGSFNIVARRESGTDCPAPRAPLFQGRAGSIEGWGARGTPRPVALGLESGAGQASRRQTNLASSMSPRALARSSPLLAFDTNRRKVAI